jgi:hypothetical protein
LAVLLTVGVLGGGAFALNSSTAGAATRSAKHDNQLQIAPAPKRTNDKAQKLLHGKADASTAGTALIDADSVTTVDGIVDSSDTAVSLEQYALENLGYTVTVVPGTQWDSMTAAQFAQYQLLVVGDPDCSETAVSATSNASTWAPVVMGTAGLGTTAGNRVVIGTDPEYHYANGQGNARPTTSDPTSAGAEHLVQDGLSFAGEVPGATGVYFDTSCFDNGSDVATLDQLTTVTTASPWIEDTGPPCGGSVSQIASNPSFDTGPTVLQDSDIEGWECSVHISFPTFPADFDALAVATDTATTPTCGTDPDTDTTACGEAYVLLAGEDIVTKAPNLSLTPATSTDPEGGTHTVTALVTQGSPAAPVSGAVVTFSLTGQNSGVSGTCTTSTHAADPTCATDSTGQVLFTYSDTNGAGTDTIGGSVTLSGETEHATASEIWTAPVGQPTTVTTSLSGGGSTGATISVPSATAVTDSATLAGTNAAEATGTVTYDVYSDAGCTTAVSSGSAETITTHGALPASAPVTLSTPGTYYWQATYSGDANNIGSSSTCGSEVETVSGSGSPPTCELTSTIAGPPKEITVTVQAPAGLSTIGVTESVNDTVVVPTFTMGDTSKVVVTATKVNQSAVSELALSVTDVNGSNTTCDPADFGLRGDVAQSAGNLNAGEGLVSISNSGLSKVTITVNGTRKVVSLRTHERTELNLNKLFVLAHSNHVVVKGTGSGSANVLFAD